MLKGATVIKIGGNEVDDAGWIAALAAAVAGCSGPLVLVHGGGKEVSRVQRTLGAEPEWRDGLRVTTPEALRAVSMVLSGVVNKRLVAAFVGAGRPAIGISGEDAGLLLAAPARGGALGRTGTIVRVSRGVVDALTGAGYLPIVSPVSRGLDGEALNVNADDAAAALAVALGARRFLMVSNVPGCMAEGEVLPQIDADAAQSLIDSGVASGGMGPKLLAAASAARGGVEEVRIGGLGLLDGNESGTRVFTRTPLAATA
jgi:acetylglutamate kinase